MIEKILHNVIKRKDPFNKNFIPLAKSDIKPLPLINFSSALEEVVPNSILFTAVLKPKIDFVSEIITEWAAKTDVEVTSIESLTNLSKTKVEFLENLDLLSIAKNSQMEVCTRGQCCNEQWYLCRRGIAAASKPHEVIRKMRKVRKVGAGVVNIWSLKEKFLGMTFVIPNIPALIHLQNTLKTTNRTALFQNVSWFSTKPCHTLG